MFIDLLFELTKSDEWLQDAYSRSNMYKQLEAIYAPDSGEHSPNIIFGLFYYVGIMVNKKLNAKPIIIFDTILGILLLITLIAWFFGLVEIRDNNIGTSFMLPMKGML